MDDTPWGNPIWATCFTLPMSTPSSSVEVQTADADLAGFLSIASTSARCSRDRLE